MDIQTEKGERFSQELTESGYPNLFVLADLTDEQQCHDAVALILARFGKIDVLINNAGVNDKIGLSSPVSAFRQSLEKNLIHIFTMTHCALPALKESKGAIINIGSKVAFTGQGDTSGYAAAKGGILALTREWALDLAQYDIRVNAIIPAEVMTENYEQWIKRFDNPENRLREITNKIPLGNRMTSTREIAHTALFLASSMASHTTGQFLFVDGGYVHFDRAYSIL